MVIRTHGVDPTAGLSSVSLTAGHSSNLWIYSTFNLHQLSNSHRSGILSDTWANFFPEDERLEIQQPSLGKYPLYNSSPSPVLPCPDSAGFIPIMNPPGPCSTRSPSQTERFRHFPGPRPFWQFHIRHSGLRVRNFPSLNIVHWGSLFLVGKLQQHPFGRLQPIVSSRVLGKIGIRWRHHPQGSHHQSISPFAFSWTRGSG